MVNRRWENTNRMKRYKGLPMFPLLYTPYKNALIKGQEKEGLIGMK